MNSGSDSNDNGSDTGSDNNSNNSYQLPAAPPAPATPGPCQVVCREFCICCLFAFVPERKTTNQTGIETAGWKCRKDGGT